MWKNQFQWCKNCPLVKLFFFLLVMQKVVAGIPLKVPTVSSSVIRWSQRPCWSSLSQGLYSPSAQEGTKKTPHPAPETERQRERTEMRWSLNLKINVFKYALRSIRERIWMPMGQSHFYTTSRIHLHLHITQISIREAGGSESCDPQPWQQTLKKQSQQEASDKVVAGHITQHIGSSTGDLGTQFSRGWGWLSR